MPPRAAADIIIPSDEPNTDMILTISGPSGSGKSTTAAEIGRRLCLPVIDTGKMFRRLAAKHGMDVYAFGRYAAEHPEVDRELDRSVIEKAKKAGSIVLQGRLAGWMTHLHGVEAYRVWLAAPVQTRAARIARREGGSYLRTLKATAARDRENRARYRRAYGLDLNDLHIYDSVVRTGNLTVEEAADLIIRQVSKVWRKKRRPTRSRPRQKTRKRRK